MSKLKPCFYVLLFKYENNILGIEKNDIGNYIVYPNTTSGLLKIESKQLISKISVSDILEQPLGSFQNTNHIDLSNIDVGVYFVIIEDGERNSQTIKLIRE